MPPSGRLAEPNTKCAMPLAQLATAPPNRPGSPNPPQLHRMKTDKTTRRQDDKTTRRDGRASTSQRHAPSPRGPRRPLRALASQRRPARPARRGRTGLTTCIKHIRTGQRAERETCRAGPHQQIAQVLFQMRDCGQGRIAIVLCQHPFFSGSVVHTAQPWLPMLPMLPMLPVVRCAARAVSSVGCLSFFLLQGRLGWRHWGGEGFRPVTPRQRAQMACSRAAVGWRSLRLGPAQAHMSQRSYSQRTRVLCLGDGGTLSWQSFTTASPILGATERHCASAGRLSEKGDDAQRQAWRGRGTRTGDGAGACDAPKIQAS